MITKHKLKFWYISIILFSLFWISNYSRAIQAFCDFQEYWTMAKMVGFHIMVLSIFTYTAKISENTFSLHVLFFRIVNVDRTKITSIHDSKKGIFPYSITFIHKGRKSSVQIPLPFPKMTNNFWGRVTDLVYSNKNQ